MEEKEEIVGERGREEYKGAIKRRDEKKRESVGEKRRKIAQREKSVRIRKRGRTKMEV